MRELNLEAKNSAQQRIKDYLEENASEVLAEKINNGVSIEKDGKVLINRKTLDGFMSFATEEARKFAQMSKELSPVGAVSSGCVCIEDSVVFGWAIHYFEEESIEGTLYNEDGTEYEKPKPAPKKVKEKKKTEKTEMEEPVKETPLAPPIEESADFTILAPKKKKAVPQTSAPQMSFFDF